MLPEPLSTYRIQLNSHFGFDDAAKIIPYLEELGIGQLYCSPVFQAVAGSTHGYDVNDLLTLAKLVDQTHSKMVELNTPTKAAA